MLQRVTCGRTTIFEMAGVLNLGLDSRAQFCGIRQYKKHTSKEVKNGKKSYDSCLIGDENR